MPTPVVRLFRLFTVLCLYWATRTNGAVLYVNLNSTNPVSPFSTWGTAATNIQDAVDAANTGDTILVTNGIYSTGGEAIPTFPETNLLLVTNRVVITNAIIVQSVNGPAVTSILGAFSGSRSLGTRGAYLANGAELAGFSISERNAVMFAQYGGGVFCASTNEILSNCIITGNSSGTAGGVYQGTLLDCTISDNQALYNGGGVYDSFLVNCTVSSNNQSSSQSASDDGGGAYDSVLLGCTVISNSAYSGGGAAGGTLSNCTIAGNSGGGVSANAILNNCTLIGNSSGSGGAAYSATLTGCILVGNRANFAGGGAANCTLSNCIVFSNIATPLDGGFGGGAYGCTVFNCQFMANTSGNGAGAYGGTLYNSLFVSNNATMANSEAAVADATLNNCTIVFNTGPSVGGAIDCVMFNCIVMSNGPATSTTSNYSGCTMSYCCTSPLPGSGTNNISADPLFTDYYHLSSNSPCRGAGNSAYANGVDIDGQPWANPPSIGCDEYYPGGPLTISIQALFTNLATALVDNFTGLALGVPSSVQWNFGDGTVVSNSTWEPTISHQWSSPGDYTVTVTVYNQDNLGGVSASVLVQVLAQPVHYVNLNSLNPAPPYSDWTTAATNIQDAIDAASSLPGELVVVTGGVYNVGGRIVYGALSNRVVVAKPLILQSVNGPASTTIEGYQPTGSTNGGNAIRCVYLTNYSMLAGFTLANGSTLSSGDGNNEQSGGGAFCSNATAVISNCIFINNSANENGGGSMGGELKNCAFISNSASIGGGCFNGTLANCTLTGNSAVNAGGGAESSALTGCTLGSNNCNSGFGGAADTCSANGCFFFGNGAQSGGAVSFCTVNNSLLSGNFASFEGGGVCSSFMNNCTIVSNSAVIAGGVGEFVADPGSLTNCIIYDNTAGIFPNYDANAESAGRLGFDYCCTTPMPANGTGNITNNPLFADPLIASCRLQAFSPCVNAGNNAYASNATDLAGNPRISGGTVDMGAYELQFHYVSQSSTNPVRPYSSWATAATNIQFGVGVAFSYDAVLVSNGVYGTGGAPPVDAPLPFVTIASVNGPSVTSIDGGGTARCALLEGGDVLSGFTLTNGTTHPILYPPLANGGGVSYSDLAAIGGIPTVINCVLVNNSAYMGGGAFDVNLENCVLISNTANWGGGAFEVNLTNCVLTANTANQGGGAAECSLTDCLLTGNSATGAGVFYNGGGGAAGCVMNNCTIVSNSAVFLGGGVAWLDASAASINFIPFQITNCICIGNSASNYSNLDFYSPYDFLSNASASYCCTIPLPTNGIGNITNDPMFVNPSAGDFRLQSNSPCINAGNNVAVSTTTDLDGNPRISGGTVDIGAYEFQNPASIISYAWLEQYGFATDGSADFADPDHDGMNNYEEWIAGTDPTNPLSLLEMFSPSTNGTNIVVSWESVTNITYYLQRATNITSIPAFQTIATGIPGQTGTTSYRDTNALPPGPYFYRVGVQ